MDPDCYYGDHSWKGTGACVRCGLQLRCSCGRFVREDDLERHLQKDCPMMEAERDDERRRIEQTFAP